MTSASPYLDREILTKRCPGARCGSCLSDRQIRVDVKGDDGIDAVEGSISHHFVCAAARLLRWLKDTSPSHRQRPCTIKGECRPEQDRSMRIVTTCVHDPGFSRTVRDLILFLNWEGIDIRPNSYDRRSRIRRLDDVRDDTALSWSNLMRNLCGGKPFAQISCGSELLPA